MATPTKATTPKKRKAETPAKVSVSKPEVVQTSYTTSTPSPLSLKVSRKFVLIGLVAVGLAVLLYTYRSLFIAATVNGQPISRLVLVQELEKQGGKQTLSTLVTKTLIGQEAAKKNITVSQKKVDEEMKKIEASLAQQGQTLDQVLQMQGMTKQSLTDQIRTQKMVEGLVGKVSVSDKEIDAYIKANEASIPEGGTAGDVRKSVKTQLEQQKVNEKAQAMLQNLQKNAKINYFVSY